VGRRLVNIRGHLGKPPPARTGKPPFTVVFPRRSTQQVDNGTPKREGTKGMSILWIILIVVLVLALLGFFSRGYW
jgi:hypothetical protein